jgi:hypothetical protein
MLRSGSCLARVARRSERRMHDDHLGPTLQGVQQMEPAT